MANSSGGFDPGTRAILEELRDLRAEMSDDRRRADEEHRRELRRSDERFERMLQEFRTDSARRDTMTQRMFKQIHTVGLAIVKTLTRQTSLLERIDRNTRGRRANGGPGTNGGRSRQ